MSTPEPANSFSFAKSAAEALRVSPTHPGTARLAQALGGETDMAVKNNTNECREAPKREIPELRIVLCDGAIGGVPAEASAKPGSPPRDTRAEPRS